MSGPEAERSNSWLSLNKVIENFLFCFFCERNITIVVVPSAINDVVNSDDDILAFGGTRNAYGDFAILPKAGISDTVMGDFPWLCLISCIGIRFYFWHI